MTTDLMTIQPIGTQYPGFIERAKLADSSKYSYFRMLIRFQEFALQQGKEEISLWDHNLVKNFFDQLPLTGQRILKSVISLWAKEQEMSVKAGAIDPEVPLEQIQRTTYYLEALTDSIKVPAHKGKKIHSWLSRGEIKELLSLPDRSTLRGLRDYVLLSVLLGSGLRRSELISLTFEDIQELPLGEEKRTVISVTGKGSKVRTVPISKELETILNDWKGVCDGGNIARGVRGSKLTEGLTVIALYNIVRKYGKMIDKPDLSCHDLRRSFAQLGYDGGVPLTQIKETLGHSSLATTQRYLDLKLNLSETVSDHIPLSY